MSDLEKHVFINELLHEMHQCTLTRNTHQTMTIFLINGEKISLGYHEITNTKNTITYADGTIRTLKLACAIVHPNVPDTHPMPISMRICNEQKTILLFRLGNNPLQQVNNEQQTIQILRLNHVTHYTIKPGNHT